MDALVLIEPKTYVISDQNELIICYSVYQVWPEDWNVVLEAPIHLTAKFEPQNFMPLNIFSLLNIITLNTADYFQASLQASKTIIWRNNLCLLCKYSGPFIVSAAAAAARLRRQNS
jgi:hypothetical protein